MRNIFSCVKKSALSNCFGTQVVNRKLSVILSNPSVILQRTDSLSICKTVSQQLCAVNHALSLQNNERDQSSR